MALTNFAELTPQQKIVWSRDVWSAARDQMFVRRFLGKGANSVIQRITELTKTERGEQVIMHLVADLVEDGVIGDNEREGNEEEMTSDSILLNIDLISHGVRNKGKLSDQKTVINFRETGKDRLSYWLANRVDQLAFLTMSGISYAYKNNGAARTGPFANLAFAADVSAPSAKRTLMWDGTALATSNTGSITSAYTVNYKMIVDAIAYAKEHYIKPLMDGGKEYYCLFVAPGTLAQLKKDADYQRAVVAVATKSGLDSPFFTGATVTVDGAVIHEHRLVYTTKGAASGWKWGSGGTVNGTRTLLCGAQALGFADIGVPEWDEKTFQYNSQQGINVDKMLGMIKPVFYSIYDLTSEDFGILAIDHYLQ